jgi:ATP-dependent helicase Lhr and Lhr-like helicase
MNPVLRAFSPAVASWFGETFVEPTAPQLQGWPAIQRGEHTLILAPTGSGKTLAAFLWGIDRLLTELLAAIDAGDESPAGIRVLYVSPLKALNNDIERNLRTPLAGIRRAALQTGLDLPSVQVAVRSGDTPSAERQRLVRRPPHILITTPESLYLLLTSPRARDMFAPVHTVIVDEIHTMAGSKRGAHLALSLERLERLTTRRVQRVGLSATIRPLDEVARFLGGSEEVRHDSDRDEPRSLDEDDRGADRPAPAGLRPRPVTVVDAGYRKGLDLLVETVAEDPADLPGGSVWPAITPRVLDLIRQHRTTLVFVNNRRLAERTADRLNEQLALESRGDEGGLVVDGVPRGSGFAAAGRGMNVPLEGIEPLRAHHGSMAKAARLDMEQGLKEGRLRALVGTSSLELGIDIGSVDLVVQLQSPRSVAQGLQRVGRSGHLVGQTSKGRVFPTHREDLVEAAVVARGMMMGEVEPVRTPTNALDVLAQQVTAMVSVEDLEVEEVLATVRRAHPYRGLTERAFYSVIEMLSGRYPTEVHRELRPRISWDRVNGRLSALPGARLLALTNAGTIPDRGTYGAYLPDGRVRIGELDEEFVFETRPGDTFMLGSQVWRVLEITEDRVIVKEAPGAFARAPFWHGDYPWRPYELGLRVGRFRRELQERARRLAEALGLENSHDLLPLLAPEAAADTPAALSDELERLQAEYALDSSSARQVVAYVVSMLDRTGAVSSDEEVLLETFSDAVGDPRIVVHSPFGGRVNGPWGLALADAIRERTGIEVEVQSGDDGILLRLPGAADPPLELVASLSAAEARERLLRSLADSAVFGAQFRMNAARSLLLPGNRPGRRTPFWLQRLRAKDLLQAVRRFPEFPLLAETYRDCLEDVMDLPHLEQVLEAIGRGDIKMTPVESAFPSAVAQGLMWSFTNIYLYEWDTPKAERQMQSLMVSRELLGDLLRDVALDELLRPEAVEAVEARRQRTAERDRARTPEELFVLLLSLGDLTLEEAEERTEGPAGLWLEELAARGRVRLVSLSSVPGATGATDAPRWVPVELVGEYEAAFGLTAPTEAARDSKREAGDSKREGGGSERESRALEEAEAPWAWEAGSGEALAPERADPRCAVLMRFLARSGPFTQVDVLARYPFPADWLERELDALVVQGRLARGLFRRVGRPGDLPRVAQYVDTATLQEIHRGTLRLLRREVRPVPLAVYSDLLGRWQHLDPQERLAGAGGLRRVVQQLRAVPLAGLALERDVLPLRLTDYRPDELETLFGEGQLFWVASGGADPRRARVRLLFRGEGAPFLEAPPELEGLSERARHMHVFLAAEGALFLADIREGLGLDESEARAGLAELALVGLVTSDSLAALRDLLGATPTLGRPARTPGSALEQELARRLAGRTSRSPVPRRPSRTAYRAASRRARERLREQTAPPAGIRAGRWSLVRRFGVLGKAVPEEERSRRQARQLLLRHAVVTRVSLEREEGGWEWPAIRAQLDRMEMRGEVRRGYFVSGMPGPQFALPEVVERLRALAAEAGQGDEEPRPVVMNATDPANLWGAGSRGEPSLAFARVPSTWVVQLGGRPVLVVEDTGGRLRGRPGAPEGELRSALRAVVEHLSRFLPRVTVSTWNGTPVLESEAAGLLETLGFYPDHPGMTFEREAAARPRRDPSGTEGRYQGGQS